MARKKKRERQKRKRTRERARKAKIRAQQKQRDEHRADADPLTTPHPERCRPPIYVDKEGHRVLNLREALELDAEHVSQVVIRQAYRDLLIQHPPELEPEIALTLREARDFLLSPEHFFERELGMLLVPDPKAWGLPASFQEAYPELLDAETRLQGQVMLYALLEDALWDQGLKERLHRPPA